jgi:hypothetical protein
MDIILIFFFYVAILVIGSKDLEYSNEHSKEHCVYVEDNKAKKPEKPDTHHEHGLAPGESRQTKEEQLWVYDYDAPVITIKRCECCVEDCNECRCEW